MSDILVLLKLEDRNVARIGRRITERNPGI